MNVVLFPVSKHEKMNPFPIAGFSMLMLFSCVTHWLNHFKNEEGGRRITMYLEVALFTSALSYDEKKFLICISLIVLNLELAS
jgi:hypothetical protein